MCSKALFFLFASHIMLIIGINCTEESSNDLQKTSSFCEQSKILRYQNQKSTKLPYNATALLVGLLDAWNLGKLKNYFAQNPEGVLNEKKDPILKLDSSNFEQNVYSKTSFAWFIFFNSENCKSVGCLMDSKMWKNLADSVYNWRKLLALGEVNCDQLSNKELCSKYYAWENRKVQYFLPFIDPSVNPRSVSNSHPIYPNIYKPNFKNNVAQWRSTIIMYLDWLTPERNKPAHWPKLAPVTLDETLESILVANNMVYDPEIWVFNLFKCLLTREKHLSVSDLLPDSEILANHIDSTWRSNNSQLLILIVEKDDSYVGRELILDLYGAPVTVRHTSVRKFVNATGELPQVFVITPDNTRERVPLWITSRSGIYLILRSYLRNKGYLLLGNSVECGKYLSLEDLEELAKKAKTHPITVDQIEIIHCMQEKMIHAMVAAIHPER